MFALKDPGYALKPTSVSVIVAQLFESPGAKEVGRSHYAVRIDDQAHQARPDDMRLVAQELAEKTHTLK